MPSISRAIHAPYRYIVIGASSTQFSSIVEFFAFAFPLKLFQVINIKTIYTHTVHAHADPEPRTHTSLFSFTSMKTYVCANRNSHILFCGLWGRGGSGVGGSSDAGCRSLIFRVFARNSVARAHNACAPIICHLPYCR